MSHRPNIDQLKIRTVMQRCSNADVFIEDSSCGHLASGIVALVGFSYSGDHCAVELLEQINQLDSKLRSQMFAGVFERWWSKVAQLRLFTDEAGKMNLSLFQMPDTYGVYLVSQFTLFADLKKGHRPGFSGALSAPLAQICFEQLVEYVRHNMTGRPVCSGQFGADMRVSFINEGPVTLMFDYSVSEGFVNL